MSLNNIERLRITTDRLVRPAPYAQFIEQGAGGCVPAQADIDALRRLFERELSRDRNAHRVPVLRDGVTYTLLASGPKPPPKWVKQDGASVLNEEWLHRHMMEDPFTRFEAREQRQRRRARLAREVAGYAIGAVFILQLILSLL